MKRLHISREFIQEKKDYIFSEQIIKSGTPIDTTVRKTEYTQSNCVIISTISKLLALSS
jgi:hypothetical protein